MKPRRAGASRVADKLLREPNRIRGQNRRWFAVVFAGIALAAIRALPAAAQEALSSSPPSNQILVQLDSRSGHWPMASTLVEKVKSRDAAFLAELGQPTDAQPLVLLRIQPALLAELPANDPRVVLHDVLVLTYADSNQADAAATLLALNPRVIGFRRSAGFRYSAPNDPLYTNSFAGLDPQRYQWGAQRLHLAEAWDMQRGYGYAGLLDNGIQIHGLRSEGVHEDLRANYRPHFSRNFDSANGVYDDSSNGNPRHGGGSNTPDNLDEEPYNVMSGTTILYPNIAGHGTHTAGIIAAQANNSLGVAGACQGCSLALGRITSWDDFYGNYPNSAHASEGLSWMTNLGSQVVNMSFGAVPQDFGCTGSMTYVCLTLDAAALQDMAVVAAGGNQRYGAPNNGSEKVQFPASYAGVIAVAGAQYDPAGVAFWDGSGIGANAFGSNRSSRTDIAAPASDVISSMYTGSDWNPLIPCGDNFPAGYFSGYGDCTGTSMAAPYVAGVVQLYRSTKPTAPLSEVKAALTSNTTACVGSLGAYCGHGVPDAARLVRAALGSPAAVNRTTPLFMFYSTVNGTSDPSDHFYTVVPQMATAAILGTLLPRPLSGQQAIFGSQGPPTPGYTAFPGLPNPCTGFSPPCTNRQPRALVSVLTTFKNPIPGGPDLLPLYRLSWTCPALPCFPSADHISHVYATDTSERWVSQVGYKIDGIEGYVYPKSVAQPPGTVKLCRKYDGARDDYVLFPGGGAAGTDCSATSDGYTGGHYTDLDTLSDANWIGWAYPAGAPSAVCSGGISCGAATAALVNGSFEIPALGSGYQYNPSAPGIGWTFAADAGIQGNGSAWGAAPAPDGTQTAFIQRLGTIAQTLNLNAGSYALAFKAARRACCVSPYLQPVRVTLDGTQIAGLISPATTSFSPFGISFSVVTGGSHTIAFTGTDASDKTTFLDNVTLASLTLSPTTTTLTTSANPSTLGATVTFTASVAGVGPTGAVAFTSDAVTMSGCGAVALVRGAGTAPSTATCSTSSLTAGSHSVVATYGGDASNAGSASSPLVQVVSAGGALPPPTALKRFTPASIAPGANSTLTVTLNPKLLYVAGNGDNTLMVVDSATSTVLATIPVGAAPYYTAVNAAGTRAYVTNNGSATVSVLDTATNGVIASIGVGTQPSGVAVSSSRNVAYVTNYGSSTVSVLNTATNSVIATVIAGSNPINVAMNPAGTRAYVSNMGSATVSVFDTATNSVIKTISVGAAPRGIVVHPAGTFAYVVSANVNRLSVIDAASNTIVATAAVGAYPTGIALSPAGSRAYVANYNGSSVSVFDTTLKTVVKTISVSANPFGVAANPAGTKVYVSCPTAIAVIDSATNTVAGTFPAGLGPSLQANSIVAPFSAATTGVAFTDIYPTGLVNTAAASPVTTCGGTVTAVNNGSSISLSGGTIPSNDSCMVTVNVTSASAGAYTNRTGPVSTANAGTGAAASGTLTVIQRAPTTTTLTSAPNPSTIGTSVTFTATITGSAPTGTVNFTADGTPIAGCNAVALPAKTRTATCSTSSLAGGTHSIVASYSGDAANIGSTSSTLSQVVTKATSTTSVSSSANPSTLGASVTFAASVAGVAPTGTVAFTDGGATIGGCGAVVLPAGTANAKTATCGTSSLSAGTHSIVAAYGGDASNNGSVSPTLSQAVITDHAPVITLVSPQAAQGFVRETISFTVVATDADPGDPISVSLLGMAGPAPMAIHGPGPDSYIVSWTPSAVGDYNLSVQVTDSHGLSATQAVSAHVIALPSGAVGDADLICSATGTSGVGTTSGSFGVRDSGAATYSIPIQAPPGTAGLQPSLALAYSSHGGDGLLGIGWSLAGLPAVTHCPATETQDGTRRGFNYDAAGDDDAFCLDGQRLIPIGESYIPGPDPNYPWPIQRVHKIEYRTEVDSYTKIESYADPDGITVVGPYRFRATTKSGQILDFGSRWWILSRGWYQHAVQSQRVNTIKLWALDSLSDRVGNYMLVDYAGTNENVLKVTDQRPLLAQQSAQAIGSFPETEFWPTAVRYYSAHDVNTQYPGYNEVAFFVKPRSEVAAQDVQRFYDQGAGMTTLTQRLDAIRVTVDKSDASAGTRVRTYYLNYGVSPTSKRLQLQNVQEQADDLTVLPPTSFAWTSTGLAFQGPGSTSALTTINADAATKVKVADLDGDGRSDLVRYAGSGLGGSQNWEVCLGPLDQGNCAIYSANSYGDNGDVTRWQVGDITGDGRAWLITYDDTQRESQFWRICRFNGSGFDPCQFWSGPILYRTNQEWNEFYWADFDGDGKMDIMSFHYAIPGSNLWDVCLSTGSGYNCQRNVPIVQFLTSGNLRARVMIADINGDGKADYLERASQDIGEDQWKVCLADFGPGIAAPGFQCADNFIHGLKGDFNHFVIMDLNGDGLADMITRVDSASVPFGEPCAARGDCWQVCLSVGDGAFEFYDPNVRWGENGLVDGLGNPVDPYFAPRCRYWSGLNAPVDNVIYGDFNGDGRTDMAAWDPVNRWWTLCYSTGSGFSCQAASNNFPIWADGGAQHKADAVVTGDFNGDGKTDILLQNSHSSWAKGMGDPGFADQIARVTTGLGATTDISYAPITDSSVYAKGNSPPGLRELVIQSPLYVVKETKASNGIGGQFVTTYFYEGLKGRTDGRGIEGFYRRRMLDGNGILSEVENEQAFPLSGRPRRATKWAPVSGVRPDPTAVLRFSPLDQPQPGVLTKVNDSTQLWSSVSRSAGQFYQGAIIAPIAQPTAFARRVYQVELAQSVEQSFDLDGTALPRTVSSIAAIDDFGNPGQVIVSTFDAAEGGNYSKQTFNQYQTADRDNWIIGRLTQASVTSFKPTGESLTRTSSWSHGSAIPSKDHPYDGYCWRGFVCSETIEPGSVNDGATYALWQQTSYVYDRYGNRMSTSIALHERGPGDTVTRTTQTSYFDGGDGAFNNRGRFILSTTPPVVNGIALTESRQYDNRFGGVTVVNGSNGMSSTASYDGFGRRVCATAFNGASGTGHRLDQSEAVVQSCGSADLTYPGINTSCQGGESYRVRSRASGGAASYVFYDTLQRERRAFTKAFNNLQWASASTSYDALGRKQSSVRPAGNGTITTVFGYDVLNRVKTETTTGNNGAVRSTVATTIYSGLTTTLTRTNPSGSGAQTVTRTVNSQGLTTRVADGAGQTTFVYDALGNMRQTTGPPTPNAPGGIAVTMGYDLRGRKTSMSDPDMGNWQYGYNGAGNLVFQRDGKGQETRQLYDLLGRLSERREYPGAEIGTGPGVIANGTLWTYDACNFVATGNGAAGRGKLCRMETHAFFPYSESNLVHRQERAYDGAARTAMTTTTVGSTVYVSGAQYDSNGRISQLEYPSGLVVKQSYSGWNGQLAAVTDAVGIAYWQATSRNPDGQIASMRVGPHTTSKTYDPLGRVATIATPGLQSATYAFDELGNLTSRGDPLVGQPAETYSYDLVNRLVSANGSIIASYDATGNITWRSDVGNYSYYPGTHRLQSAGSQFYSYDANGTLTGGGGRTVVPTVFNMPQRIAAGNNIIDFSYDGDHARTAEFGSVSGLTFLVGSQFYEEQFKPDGTLVRRHYITTPEGVVALVQQRAAGPAVTSTIRYWHKDHLGSVVAISNEQAQTVERVTFSVWGRRANPFLPAGEPLEERGYTGHETLDDVAVTSIGLVHMNGRIYDPATGRFLSADPMVQDPFNAQSYNRYSYVLNNPLSFTDPTGFSWWTRWRTTIFAAVAAIATYGATSWLITTAALESAGGSTVFAAVADFQYGATVAVLTPAGSAVAGAAAGFAAGGIMGGNIESALTGALAGGLSGGVAGYYGATYSVTRVGVEGLVGGINSRIQGGRFAAGLESGLLFSALTYATATTRAEMVKFASTVPGNVGYSPGAFGIAGRIGGELINADEWKRVNLVPFDPSDPNYDAYLHRYWEEVKGGPFGGVQGRNPGTLFGIPYPPGGLADRLVESFAGFHDWLNKIPFYNFDPASPLYGTSHDFLDGGVLAHYLGETVSAVNVLLAAPVVGAAITPEYLRSVLLSDYRKGAQ